MTVAKEVDSVREAVAVLDTAQTLQNAIDELLSSGFHRAELSLVASEADVVSKLGHKYTRELEDNPTVPRAAYISTEAIGDAQGAIIGALFNVGAGLLMGPVAAAGGTLVAMAAQPPWEVEPEDWLEHGSRSFWATNAPDVFRSSSITVGCCSGYAPGTPTPTAQYQAVFGHLQQIGFTLVSEVSAATRAPIRISGNPT